MFDLASDDLSVSKSVPVTNPDNQIASAKSIYFAPIANGLGDLIVCLPAIQWLVGTGIPTHLVIRSPEQAGLSSQIAGLAGTIDEVALDADALPPGVLYINMRAHPLQKDHIWGSAEFESKYPGYKITEVLKGISADWQIGADYDQLQPLAHKTVAECAGKVLLVPGSAGRAKYWPARYWSELAAQLASAGQECVVIGQPDKCDIVADLIGAAGATQATDAAPAAHLSQLPHLPHFATPTLVDALDAISSARAVVAVDTGLMHMAVHQGVPTVALFRSNTMFLRPLAYCRNLIAPACDPRCIAQEFAAVPNQMLTYDKGNETYTYWKTWDCLVHDKPTHCMSQIAVAQVHAAVTELLLQSAVHS